MNKFFILEGGYLALSLFIILITIYVTTRPFISKNAFKQGIIGVSSVLSIAIASHYTITTNRMDAVKNAFEKDLPILCESRMQTKVSQFVTIQKSKEWSMEEDNFVSPNYQRAFFSARCIVKD